MIKVKYGKQESDDEQTSLPLISTGHYLVTSILAGFLRRLHFNPEDGGSMFLRNVDTFMNHKI
jgi:hypothetical protein